MKPSGRNAMRSPAAHVRSAKLFAIYCRDGITSDDSRKHKINFFSSRASWLMQMMATTSIASCTSQGLIAGGTYESPGHAGPSPQAPMEGQCGFGRTPSIDPAPVTSVQGNISSFPTRSFLPKRNERARTALGVRTHTRLRLAAVEVAAVVGGR